MRMSGGGKERPKKTNALRMLRSVNKSTITAPIEASPKKEKSTTKAPTTPTKAATKLNKALGAIKTESNTNNAKAVKREAPAIDDYDSDIQEVMPTTSSSAKKPRNEPVSQPQVKQSSSSQSQKQNSGSNNNSKKVVKVEIDENEEKIDDRTERTSTSSVNSLGTASNIPPKELYTFCKYIMDLEKQNVVHVSSRCANHKFNIFLSQDNLETVDLNAMYTAFISMLRSATQPHEFPMLDALKRVSEYTQTKKVLTNYPGFPRDSPRVWNLYLKRLGVTPLTASDEIRERFKNKQDKDVLAAQQELERIKAGYVEQYKGFLERYKDGLFQSQIDFIQKKIKKFEERPLTAFDLYKRTQEDNYTELPEEEREAKLFRRFNKLSDQERKLLEMLIGKI